MYQYGSMQWDLRISLLSYLVYAKNLIKTVCNITGSFVDAKKSYKITSTHGFRDPEFPTQKCVK